MKLTNINLTKEGTHEFTLLSQGLVVNEHYENGRYVFDGIGDIKKPCRIWFFGSCDDGFDTDNGHIDFWNGVLKISPALYESIQKSVEGSATGRFPSINSVLHIGKSFSTVVKRDGKFLRYSTMLTETNDEKPYPYNKLTKKFCEAIRPIHDITTGDQTIYLDDTMDFLIQTIEEEYHVKYNGGEFFTLEELGLTE